MWDERYSEPGYAYGTRPNDFLVENALRLKPGSRLLCLAEGEGRNAVYLAGLGHKVTAVDQSKVGLDKALQMAREHGVSIHTVHKDLSGYEPGTEQWDGVISIWAHMPADSRRDLHHKVINALKPGGVLILEAYTLEHLDMSGVGGPPPTQADKFMSLQVLKDELSGMELVLGQEVERDVHEGKYHQGHSAVVQVIAIKPD